MQGWSHPTEPIIRVPALNISAEVPAGAVTEEYSGTVPEPDPS